MNLKRKPQIQFHFYKFCKDRADVLPQFEGLSGFGCVVANSLFLKNLPREYLEKLSLMLPETLPLNILGILI